MDLTTVIVVLLIVIGIGGGAAYLLRDFGRQMLARDAAGLRAGLEAGLEARQEAALGGLRAELERLRGDLQSFATEQQTLLARLRERGAELDRLIARSRDLLDREEQTRRAAERGPARPSAALVNGAAERLRERQADALTELYRRLARVESSLAALTAPILLPGEPYQVPDEFLPEALRWDNWKEVGEAAYALGDFYSQNRPLLDDQTRQAVGACVTTLRVALTRSIYPNLQPAPTPEQTEALRAGLAQIAEALPRVRALLEQEFRSLVEPNGA